METARRKRRVTARQGTEELGISARHVRRLVVQTREEWQAEKAREREAIRVYHDDEGHSWPDTGRHFGLAEDTVKRRGCRARKERAAQALAQVQDTLPVDENRAS